MIQWNDAINSKPPIDNDDEFNKLSTMSKRVLVYLIPAYGPKEPIISFGIYVHSANFWSVEGFRGSTEGVQYWSEINPPVEV